MSRDRERRNPIIVIYIYIARKGECWYFQRMGWSQYDNNNSQIQYYSQIFASTRSWGLTDMGGVGGYTQWIKSKQSFDQQRIRLLEKYANIINAWRGRKGILPNSSPQPTMNKLNDEEWNSRVYSKIIFKKGEKKTRIEWRWKERAYLHWAIGGEASDEGFGWLQRTNKTVLFHGFHWL